MSRIILTNYAGYTDSEPQASITLEGDEIVAMRDLLERTSRHMDMGDLDDLTNQMLGLEI
tara:strand:+ start:351 stop:530 length:180 start_codon:yes stop_codon:yes gene_type:complete